MRSIAIIDIIGLTYDGDTLKKRGLGGSESAVILMAKELASIGYNVTVFNNCIDAEAKPGVYDGVEYIDLTMLNYGHDFTFDIVISSRTVFPFAKEKDYAALGYNSYGFQKMMSKAKLKAVWLHDTFCQGDHLLEQMLVDGDIDEIFTLSDFHTSYVSTCNHGKKRMQEVIKRKIFQTRNGAVLYPGEVNIAAKDRNLFVYNASVTKGMIPLVDLVWPIVKQAIPAAKLVVIGGYYRFRENAEPDEQEKTWRQMVVDKKYADLGIEFTGIIKQSDIAEILKQASFMLYPSAFPETFGISTLESLLYNTPLITNRFGALEETAVEMASYFVDYSTTPNSLYPWINQHEQAVKIAHTAIAAWHNTYLHQQKMYYCNVVKGIHGWDSVALQWKQHFCKKIGDYLPVDEYRKVSQINARVHQVYGRRFGNSEEIYVPRSHKQQRIVVVTPTYNSAEFIGRCIDSVATQDYDNWRMIVIDDATPDDSTMRAAEEAKARHPDVTKRITIIRNDFNKGAVRNHIETIREYCDPDDIVMLIDGDDWLVNDNQIFHKYNNIYDGTTEFTYGSCWSLVDNIPLIAQPYPESVKASFQYRKHKFNWNMPYTHLRTFKAYLVPINDNAFKDESGNWFKAGGDCATFYVLVEEANPFAVKCITDISYVYNDAHPLNDYKINSEEQTRTANYILSRNDNENHSNSNPNKQVY
jgi:glycosyltransferase involved in cell wall biosynthesis